MTKIIQKYSDVFSARPITNASQTEVYKPTWTTIRPGSDAHEAVPSRLGARLEYRDGRVAKV
jgi:hypothetical protein